MNARKLLLLLMLATLTLSVYAKEDTGLPVLKVSTEKDEKKNICPACGKGRTECYKLYEESKKNPALKSKVCKVYSSSITGKVRPWNCPVCRHKVNIPQKGRKYENSDTDLCPHPTGNIKFMSEMTICPSCGFSAFQEDFLRRSQPPVVKEWVDKNLTHGMRQSLHALFGLNVKISPEELIDLYKNQADIPDTIRCMNAYAYYLKRFEGKDKKVDASALARVAWLTAWSHRRAASAPIDRGCLMESVKKVLAKTNKKTLKDEDLEDSVRLMTEMYKDEQKFDLLDRQIIRIIQAGYYNRLGLNYWASGVLNQVKQEATKKYASQAEDPWLTSKFAKKLPMASRIEQINKVKNTLAEIAITRMNNINNEMRFLSYASDLIVKGLNDRLYTPENAVSMMYLVGEFERRLEHHSRSLMWLDATKQLLGEEVKIEHYAPQQLALLKQYVQDRKITPKANEKAKSDWSTLSTLAKGIRTYNAKKAAMASVPPKTTK